MIPLLIIVVILITTVLLAIFHEYHLYRLYRDEAALPEEHPEFDAKVFRKRSINLLAWMAIKLLAVTLCYAVAIEAVSLTAGESYGYNYVGDLMGGCSSTAYRNGPMATIIGLLLPLIFVRATIPSLIEFFGLPERLRKSINGSILLIYFLLYVWIVPFLMLRL